MHKDEISRAKVGSEKSTHVDLGYIVSVITTTDKLLTSRHARAELLSRSHFCDMWIEEEDRRGLTNDRGGIGWIRPTESGIKSRFPFAARAARSPSHQTAHRSFCRLPALSTTVLSCSTNLSDARPTTHSSMSDRTEPKAQDGPMRNKVLGFMGFGLAVRALQLGIQGIPLRWSEYQHIWAGYESFYRTGKITDGCAGSRRETARVQEEP